MGTRSGARHRRGQTSKLKLDADKIAVILKGYVEHRRTRDVAAQLRVSEVTVKRYYSEWMDEWVHRNPIVVGR